MTLSELLQNEGLRQREFPVVKERVFLAHAAVCPLPGRVAEAMRSSLARMTTDDQEAVVPRQLFLETRQLAARLLLAQPEEIALVGPTSLALSLVASGLAFHRGENVVIYQDDYPSNVYPWMALAEQGVQIRRLNPSQLGQIRLEDVQSQVDDQTRLVALASSHFISGYRVDLAAIGRFLQERQVLFSVDGIQTLGAFPTTVEGVDFLAADSHKWLLGPSAAGLLYVARSRQAQLRPPLHGWHNLRCPDFVALDQLVHLPDARRYEPGTNSLVHLVGLHAALQLLLEIGVENIAAELLRKRAWLIPALQTKGYVVLQADAPPQQAGGIISFFREQSDLARLHQKLAAAQIVTSLRADRTGRKYLRISPHFYNTDAELHRFLTLL